MLSLLLEIFYMINSVSLIVSFSLILGFLFGRYYVLVFNKNLFFLSKTMMKIGINRGVEKVVSFILSVIIVIFFFLYILLLSQYIPDELWFYCYTSYFFGIGLGLLFKNYFYG